MRRITVLLILFSLIGLLGCKKAEPEAARPVNSIPVEAGKVVICASGLHYQELALGTGKLAEYGKKVSILYYGMLLDASLYDSTMNRRKPFKYKLGDKDVMPAFNEGVAGMKEGGKRRFFIPQRVANYNRPKGAPEVPPKTFVTMEVELLAVK
ncbi:MAG: FKBP-type peptidyl-prolyl cis-trans isomerase [bacterium]